MLLNNQQVKEKNKENLENVLPDDNKNTTSQNLWEQLKNCLEEVYYIKMLILDKRKVIN